MRSCRSTLTCLNILTFFVGVLSSDTLNSGADELEGCVLLQTQLSLRAAPINRTNEMPRFIQTEHAGSVRHPTKTTGPWVDTFITNNGIAFLLMCLAILAVAILIFFLSMPEPNKGVSGVQNGEEVAGTRPDAKAALTKTSDASPPAKQSNIILALDGLRFLLILNVICGHFWIPRSSLINSNWLQHSTMLFFTTLSGFVRCMSLKKRDTWDWKTWKPYAANVLARFTPGNSMALVLLFLCCWYTGEWNGPLAAWPIQALFLTSALEALPTETSMYNDFTKSGNIVSWFTSAIVIGALLMPAFYNLRPQQNPTQILVSMVIVISLRCFLDHAIFHRVHEDSMLLPLIRSDASFVVRFFEIQAGALTAQLATVMKQSALQWQGWGWVFDAAICLMLLLNQCAVRQQELMGITGERIFPHWTTDCMLVLMPLLIFAAFAAAQRPEGDGSPSSGLLGRCFAYRPLSRMAKYSFGAYIYQVPAQRMWGLFLEKVVQIDDTRLTGFAHILAQWAPVGASLLFAVASEHLLEKHIRNLVQTRVRGVAA